MGVDLRLVPGRRDDQAGEPQPDRHPERLADMRLFDLLFMEPGSLIMERKMLLGIKRRAERLAREQSATDQLGPSAMPRGRA